jgi:hypothetical protein
LTTISRLIDGKLVEQELGPDDIEPEVPPIVPSTISRFQFFKQVWLMNVITADEASAAIAKQTLPAQITIAIDAIQDKDKRDEARLDALGLDQFQRSAPLTESVREANGWTPEQVDQIWIDGAKL